MKKLLKKIWLSKMTLLITLIQIILPIFGGKPFCCISFFITFFINISAMFLINYSINLLNCKGKNDEAETYFKNAPCIFQALKFSIGIIVSMVIVLTNLVYKINWIDVKNMIITWYLLPLLLVFVSTVSLDIGLYDKIKLNKKIKKLPQFLRKFLLCMFDYNNDGKMIITVKGLLSTIALILLCITVFGYFFQKSYEIRYLYMWRSQVWKK